MAYLYIPLTTSGQHLRSERYACWWYSIHIDKKQHCPLRVRWSTKYICPVLLSEVPESFFSRNTAVSRGKFYLLSSFGIWTTAEIYIVRFVCKSCIFGGVFRFAINMFFLLRAGSIVFQDLLEALSLIAGALIGRTDDDIRACVKICKSS